MTPRALAAGTNGRPSRHGPDELARVEAYQIRYAVTVGDRISLRSDATGDIDSTAVAIEATMQERSDLPRWIRELDAPAEYRNPDPWDYCPLPDQCPACQVAQRANLPESDDSRRRAALELALLRLKVLLVLRPAAAILGWLVRLTEKR